MYFFIVTQKYLKNIFYLHTDVYFYFYFLVKISIDENGNTIKDYGKCAICEHPDEKQYSKSDLRYSHKEIVQYESRKLYRQFITMEQKPNRFIMYEKESFVAEVEKRL